MDEPTTALDVVVQRDILGPDHGAEGAPRPRRSCSSPTTSRCCWSSPTGSPSCTRASWWRSARAGEIQREPGPPVHQGAAELVPVAARRPAGAGRDPGLAAGPAQPAAWLPVPAAVRLRHRRPATRSTWCSRPSVLVPDRTHVTACPFVLPGTPARPSRRPAGGGRRGATARVPLAGAGGADVPPGPGQPTAAGREEELGRDEQSGQRSRSSRPPPSAATAGAAGRRAEQGLPARPRPGPARGPGRLVQPVPRRGGRAGRRERLGQVHGGPAAGRAGAADRRHDQARRRAGQPAGPQRVPPVQERGPAGVPGPVRLAQPRPHRALPPGAADAAAPGRKSRPPRCGTEVAALLEQVRLTPAEQLHWQVPARAVRRAAAAGLVRPGAGGQARACCSPTSRCRCSTCRSGWRCSALLDDLRKRFRLALLYITHDIASARYFADEVLVMYAGQIVERGPAEEVTQQPGAPLHPAAGRAPRPTRTTSAARCENGGGSGARDGRRRAGPAPGGLPVQPALPARRGSVPGGGPARCSGSPPAGRPRAGGSTSPPLTFYAADKGVGTLPDRSQHTPGGTLHPSKTGKATMTGNYLSYRQAHGRRGGRPARGRAGRVRLGLRASGGGGSLQLGRVGHPGHGELTGEHDHPGLQPVRTDRGAAGHGRDRTHLRAAAAVRPGGAAQVLPVAGDQVQLGRRRHVGHLHDPPGREVEQRQAADSRGRRLHLQPGEGQRRNQPGRPADLQREHIR